MVGKRWGLRLGCGDGRKPRADAARNRERVLEAAKHVFTEAGAEASLEAVARRAGVGIGTLYRHFPTREALSEAVYRREVEQLAELGARLAAELPPAEALRRWLHANVAFIATKKGMAAALALAAHSRSALTAYSFARLTETVRTLLQRAETAGLLRAPVTAEELVRALIGMSMMNDQPDWQQSTLRLLDIFLDGLIGPEGRN